MKKINHLQQTKTLCVLMSLFFVFSASAIAPTISNGSFETPDATAGNIYPGVLSRPVTTNWVFEGNSFIMKNGCVYGPPNAVAGIQCAGIQNGGALYQNIYFDAGTYVLMFSAAQRNGNANNIPIVVTVDGTTISTLTATSTAYSSLQTASFTVTAGVHKIQLTTTQTANDCTVFLDNVIAVNILTGTWDQRPATSFSATYNQNFSSAWDAPFDAVFQGQWTTLNANAFGASNVSTGAINFNWSARRIMATKYLSIPYAITADIDYQNNSNRGGIVLREASGNLDNMQEPAFGDPGFNREGIALYPYVDGSSFVVQFNGVPVANTTGNKQAKIFVPAPASTTLLSRNTIRVEDYGTSVYVFYNGNPYIRIELAGKVGTYYTSGAVYDASMNVVGVFSGMTIESFGQAAIAMRDAVLRLYSAKIEMVTSGGNMETGKLSASFTPNYTQTFTTWAASDKTTFSNQWDVLASINDLGFSTDHLQMGWTPGRVIASKVSVATPYVFESDIQVLSVTGGGGVSNGGVVVRADAANSIENFQEPGNLAILPQFNSVGIAIFASSDGAGMNIQLSEALKPANATVLYRYYIPGTVGVNYRNRGVVRVEDYGTSLYVYYAGNAFARIDLSDLVGNNYTSAMVYNNQGSLVGACSNIVVPQTGKLGLASRFGAANQSIKVYRLNVGIPNKNVTINSGTNVSTLLLTPESDIVVSGNKLTINVAKTVNSITVAPGAQLELTSGNTLTAGTITLQSDATGTATLVDNTTSSPQAVTATVQQYLTAARNWYTASPIATGTAAGLNKGTSVQTYSESAKSWSILSGGDALVAGKGYVSVATTGTGTTGAVSFTGTLNTGTITVPVTRTESGSSRGFNLVANPYPSYLDWSLVTADAANANIGSTMWFRTKNTLGAYTFATHNGTSGETVTGTANTTITKFIPPSQAFWIRVNANAGPSTYSTSITFKNSMRAHRDDNGNKLKAPKIDERKRLRLQVSNGTTADETLLYFDADAQNVYDNYDSPKMFNNTASVPEIFTQVGDEKLVINGMNELRYNTEIPLGFSTAQANDFSISANELSNFEAGTKVILIDKQNPTVETELSNGVAYNFSAPITAASTGRFSLLFRAPGTVNGLNNAEKLNAQVFVNAANQITIIAPEKATYSIYNAVGILLENGVLNYKLHTINCKLNSGVYFVQLSVNGQNENQKVIIR